MTRARTTTIALSLLLWTLAPGAAPGLAQARAARVPHHALLTIFDDVRVQGDGGVVTVRGKVTTPEKKVEIGRHLRTIPGVTAVRNEIEVLPGSVSDEDLRYRIARRIYGNPSFWDHAARANPPIHIIVDRSHVTLTGVVATEVERTLAHALARTSGAVSVRSELRTAQELEPVRRLVAPRRFPRAP